MAVNSGSIDNKRNCNIGNKTTFTKHTIRSDDLDISNPPMYYTYNMMSTHELITILRTSASRLEKTLCV